MNEPVTDHTSRSSGLHTEADASLSHTSGPDRAELSIAQGKILMLNHPRSCGTAVELFLESLGYSAQCNPFDHDYYFHEQRGDTPPAAAAKDPEKKFESVVSRIMDIQPPSFIRGAGYTLVPHLDDPLLADFLKSFDHVMILVREPAYTLPSHRKTLKEDADKLTMEEAGYDALLALAQLCLKHDVKPIIIDAHESRNNPSGILNQLNLPDVPRDEIVWDQGMRERWGIWHTWKKEVSSSDRLLPFTPDQAVEELGRQDPLYPQCQLAYDALMVIRTHQNLH